MINYFFPEDILADLEKLEEKLRDAAFSDEALMAEAGGRLLAGGGKRIRPAFALMAAKFGRYDLEALMPLAVALELIHTASLIHDDVIDAAETRRGLPTAVAVWGNRISICAGDYLFAQAMQQLNRYDGQVRSILAKVMVEMCRGELQQMHTAFCPDQGVRDYLYRIKRKTAILISSSCELGALVAGATEETVSGLCRYGYALGMAFQVTDDILDLTADEDTLGKAVAGDLRQGIITLPVLYALRLSPERDWLRHLVSRQEKTEDEIQRAIALLSECAAVDEAYRVADLYIRRALAELERLPENPVKDCLREMARFIGERDF